MQYTCQMGRSRIGASDDTCELRCTVDIMWSLLKDKGKVVLGGYRNSWGESALQTTITRAQAKGFEVNWGMTGTSTDSLRQLHDLIDPPLNTLLDSSMPDEVQVEMRKHCEQQSRDAVSLMTWNVKGILDETEFPYLREIALELIEERIKLLEAADQNMQGSDSG